MREVWQRIETLLSKNAPELIASLNSGASLGEIAGAEEKLGISFPEVFKQSLQIHNGQRTDAPFFFPTSSRLLSLAEIVEFWSKELKEYASETPRFYTFYHRDHKAGKIERILGGHKILGCYRSTGNDILVDGPVQALNWHPARIPIALEEIGDLNFLDLAPPISGQDGQVIGRFDVDHVFWIASGFDAYLNEFAESLENGDYVVVPESDIRLQRRQD